MAEILNAQASLIDIFRDTLNGQVRKVLARRIHAKVRDARSDPDVAARRWPFELIQNAHDAGARDGRNGITITFDFDGEVLRYQHDAAPFGMTDIAALLTGGSSKDFDSSETTGRFGTGFLVTHTLSEQVKVNGVLELDAAYRTFQVTLDRPADEEVILRNIDDSEAALGQTQVINDFGDIPTASLEYVVDDKEIALAGLDMLEEALPYLFSSCKRLLEINIYRGGAGKSWRRGSASQDVAAEGVVIAEVMVTSTDESSTQDHWRMIRAGSTPQAQGWLLVALRRNGDSWELRKPGKLPSIFRQLPVIGGPTLPSWVILDGEFELDQERSVVHVGGDYGRPIREALAALGGLAAVAVREGWTNAFRIAQLSMPLDSLGEAATGFWRECLSAAATTVAALPLVATSREGLLPAVQTSGYEHWVDFISRDVTGSNHRELWELASSSPANDLPMLTESEGWSEIAEGWEKLGVPVSWLNLGLVGDRAVSDAEQLADLAVDGEPYVWLARYLNSVGRAWNENGIVKDHVAGLLPDQRGKLRNAGELRRGSSISPSLIQIAEDVGWDIRSHLLDEALVQHIVEHDLEAGLDALEESLGVELTEDEVIRTIIQRISAALPVDQPIGPEKQSAFAASLALFRYLWASQGNGASGIALELPLMGADGTAHKAGPRRQMLPPVAAWPHAAQPFSLAYPPGRVLAESYTSADEGNDLLNALVAWGITHPSLLVMGQREELRDRALRVLTANPAEVEGARLREVEMMQIALLEPEIINFVKQDRARACALLGLLVRYVASEDQSWRSSVPAVVRRADGDKEIRLTPSLWLADLRSKPWIPVEEGDDVTHHVPNPELVRDLIDARWLEGNRDGADLLVRHFDMDALDVHLLAVAQDEQIRQRLRDGLARIVEFVGDNTSVLEDLAARAEGRRRDMDRMRNLGLAVQENVKATLQRYGLEAVLIDRGFDYLVTPVSVRDEGSEDLSADFQVAEYKVEVKATTTDEARLTPLQAETVVRDPRAYVLCVVDLRNYPGDVYKVDWAAVDVAKYCKFIPGSDLPVDETLTFVHDAEGSDIPIRNTTALRYAVGPTLWARGIGLEQWVQRAFETEPSEHSTPAERQA